MQTFNLNIISEIDSLKSEIDTLRPIPPDRIEKVNQKLRLDWNYHSNAIEGNTLTPQETRMLIIQGYHTGNKLGRHYEEMELHNEVIDVLYDLVHRREKITEYLISNLHAHLMGKEYWAKTQDQYGNIGQMKGRPGQYKELPNNPEGKNLYKQPFEVKSLMAELINWLELEGDKKEIHPVIIAALFHIRFVTIHPFDDGNGRMSRILMNMILMSNGFVPSIIRVENRNEYIASLALAQGTDDTEPFITIVATEVKRSLELLVKAAKGESIDEPGDLDKKINFLRKKFEKVSEEIKQKKNKTSINLVIENSLLPLITILELNVKKFNQFFFTSKHDLLVNNSFISFSDINNLASILLDENNKNEMGNFELRFELKGFKKGIEQTFDTNLYFRINFYEFQYGIDFLQLDKIKIRRPYHQILTNEEIEKYGDQIGTFIYDEIEEKWKNITKSNS